MRAPMGKLKVMFHNPPCNNNNNSNTMPLVHRQTDRQNGKWEEKFFWYAAAAARKCLGISGSTELTGTAHTYVYIGVLWWQRKSMTNSEPWDLAAEYLVVVVH